MYTIRPLRIGARIHRIPRRTFTKVAVLLTRYLIGEYIDKPRSTLISAKQAVEIKFSELSTIPHARQHQESIGKDVFRKKYDEIGSKSVDISKSAARMWTKNKYKFFFTYQLAR